MSRKQPTPSCFAEDQVLTGTVRRVQPHKDLLSHMVISLDFYRARDAYLAEHDPVEAQKRGGPHPWAEKNFSFAVKPALAADLRPGDRVMIRTGAFMRAFNKVAEHTMDNLRPGGDSIDAVTRLTEKRFNALTDVRRLASEDRTVLPPPDNSTPLLLASKPG
jgi:hypothetical protein